jgi:hypothetical protein
MTEMAEKQAIFSFLPNALKENTAGVLSVPGSVQASASVARQLFFSCMTLLASRKNKLKIYYSDNLLVFAREHRRCQGLTRRLVVSRPRVAEASLRALAVN